MSINKEMGLILYRQAEIKGAFELPLYCYVEQSSEICKVDLKELEQNFYDGFLLIDHCEVMLGDILVLKEEKDETCVYVGREQFCVINVRPDNHRDVLRDWEDRWNQSQHENDT